MSTGLENALNTLRATREAIELRRSPLFDRRITELREWQSRHVATRLAGLAQRHDGEALLRFLTRTFYIEADWSELTADPAKIARRIGRILSDDRPLLIAVRLQESGDALDAEVADTLVHRYGEAPLTPRRYVRAFRAVGDSSMRAQQLAWFNELIDLLGGYADNRAAYWGFKLTRSPARAFGMGRTYDLLAEGFAAMRATRDVNRAVREAVSIQHTELERLFDRPIELPN